MREDETWEGGKVRIGGHSVLYIWGEEGIAYGNWGVVKALNTIMKSNVMVILTFDM